MLNAHAASRFRDLELAYYNAWHGGYFSQPWKQGRFPDYARHQPRKKPLRAARLNAEQLKVKAMEIVAAFGGTVRKKGE